MPAFEWVRTYPGCPCRACKDSARPHPKGQPVCACCREDGNESSPQQAERAFFDRVRSLRTEYNIRSGEGTQRDRTRIALLVTEAFLTAWGEHGGDLARGLNRAPVLEWQVFEAAEGLVCNPLEREAQKKPARRRDPEKDVRFNPLAMHPRPNEKLLPPCALVRKALTLLKGESRNADPERTRTPERNPERRCPDEVPGTEPRECSRYASVLEE